MRMTNSSLHVYTSLLQDYLLLGLRNRSDLANPMLFYIIIITMFPLAVGPHGETLQQLAPSIIWVAALLASSLSVDGIFRTDYEDGSLEQIMLSPHSKLLLISARISAHWLLFGAPLILIVLMSSMLLYLPTDAMITLVITLLLGTPVLSLVGSIAAALTMGLRSSGMLQVLLTLPLYMPLLIFSVAAVNNATKGLSVLGELYFLGAILVITLTLAPFAVISSIRIRLG